MKLTEQLSVVKAHLNEKIVNNPSMTNAAFQTAMDIGIISGTDDDIQLDVEQVLKLMDLCYLVYYSMEEERARR